MASDRFNVFSLGLQADMDTVEGNNVAENAAALVGLTFGGVQNALSNQIQQFSPGGTGFTGGTPDAYDQDNRPAETFRINGGQDQTFDSAAQFRATITYVDGTVVNNVTVVIFQDTLGRTYLAPQITANSNQEALEAAPIRSVTLTSLVGNEFLGLAAVRQVGNFLTCYVAGTTIKTPAGGRLIEELQLGDLVDTLDHGPQPIRWIGKSTVKGTGKLAPVRITAGALGLNQPDRDLLVSRQHRVMLSSKICERMFGMTEMLVPAIKLVGLPGVDVAETGDDVTYYHLMTDAHEVIFAQGVASETLLTGAQALIALG
ncbi:MAG: Hint domain-containing protein, partial [Loktanella sp.]|nr:Hint domain-containing protein [Loktanella sp.]